MPINTLSTFQKAAQRAAFQTAAEGALKPLFGPADASGLLALMLRDAATYDAETKTGGFDGSILINRCALVSFCFQCIDASTPLVSWLGRTAPERTPGRVMC
jgi:hypothetical protein